MPSVGYIRRPAIYFFSTLTRKEILSCLDEVPQDVPFSLVCFNCDAGVQIESGEQAIAEGWTDIQYDPDLSMANFIGVCPDCRPAWTGEKPQADPK